jgi:branched-subunit amino acid aminotransferase/4-amino-4-deoxychorismate lyase
MKIPDYFPNMKDYILHFLKEQKITTGTLRWQVWRKSGGKYTPTSHDIEDIIEYYEFESEKYRNEEVRLGISNRSMVCYSQLSRFKTSNALPYVLAGLEMKNSEFNDLIILNNQGHIAECISSNLFWSNNKHWYTASLNTGCVEGIMRNQVIEEFKKNQTPFIEGEFGIEYFLDIQKAFVTNSSGIYAVSVLGEIRLSEQLNLPPKLEGLRVR